MVVSQSASKSTAVNLVALPPRQTRPSPTHPLPFLRSPTSPRLLISQSRLRNSASLPTQDLVSPPLLLLAKNPLRIESLGVMEHRRTQALRPSPLSDHPVHQPLGFSTHPIPIAHLELTPLRLVSPTTKVPSPNSNSLSPSPSPEKSP